MAAKKDKFTIIEAITSIIAIRYVCPKCKRQISYETNAVPEKKQCHYCLTKLNFKLKYI
jgi:DNA-directed RNA polymerase subunit RPC12/RpoP